MITIASASVAGAFLLALAAALWWPQPHGQHHAGRVEQALAASARQARTNWQASAPLPAPVLAERDTTHALVAWQAPVSVPLPDMEVAERRQVVRAAVEAGRARFAAVPSPWADSTDTFRALTARDLGTGGE